MSSTGNRGNPNLTRVQGRQDDSGKSDIGRGSGPSHQESRDHNKHNNPGQSGHKPQQHNPAEEKH
jgi:hypothetical protein